MLIVNNKRSVCLSEKHPKSSFSGKRFLGNKKVNTKTCNKTNVFLLFQTRCHQTFPRKYPKWIITFILVLSFGGGLVKLLHDVAEIKSFYKINPNVTLENNGKFSSST